MTDATPYIVPREPGSWRALALAALVHAALFAFLWIGVRWQNETPATIEAEVWSPQPREAAPQPEPVKAPTPEPEPRREPVVKEAPKPKVVEPPVAKPDIALEQEKKRKALEEKKRQEEERERLAKEKERKRLEDEKEKLAKLKQEEAKRLEKEKADKAKKEAAEKKRKQDEAEEKLLAKMREEDMRRMTGGVPGTGGSGEAERSQGGRASAEYAGRVAAKIRSNTIYVVPESLAGNPAVEYAVNLLPDGSLRGAPRKLKSSGIAGFDEAVLRAIEKSQPFPRDNRTGTVPSSVIVSHKPKDQ
jgi:colicin import membrane protein